MDKKPGLEENQNSTEQKTNADVNVKKNQDPRANENLNNKHGDDEETSGAGSEITDGEAG